MSIGQNMKRVKMRTSDSYQEYLIESLQEPEEAAAYIEAILEAENPERELLSSALKDIIDARLRMNSLSEQAQITWEQLNKMLLESGGAEIYKLLALLDILGLRISVNIK